MSLIALRWSVALVLGAGAALLVVSLARAGGAGVLIALGAAELVAAAVFAVPAPRATRIGGLALLGALAVAAAFHAALGEAPPASFAVEAAAIWVVIAADTRARAVSP